MKFNKPARSFADQAALLLQRRLEADADQLATALEAVNYYRLSAYWHPFRNPDDTLKPGTTLDKVWRRYVFDRQLRLLAMDAIERVEIAIRTQIVNCHVLQHGPFGYLQQATFPQLAVQDHLRLLQHLDEETQRSREPFVTHFFSKYKQEKSLPLWMACELMTFGSTLTLYRGIDQRLQMQIARNYGVPDKVLLSWLRALNHTRNICAHHARLWNRVFGIKPLIPHRNKHPQWHTPVPISNDRLFGMFTVLHYLLIQVAPKSRWKLRLNALFQAYADIPVTTMGFPANFDESPLWQTPGQPDTPDSKQ